MRGRTYDLSWVDEFIRNVRPYIFVRSEDNLLIKKPNRAQKLNPQGVGILDALLGGSSIDEVLDRVGRQPRRVEDVALFLFEVKRSLEGTLTEANRTRAVDVQPFTMDFCKLPVLAEVAITYRCNLRCSFCYAGCNCTVNPVADDREMTVPEIRRVLRRIYHEARVPSVSFTGGEPTLRRELPELVDYASRLGLRVNLITNGTAVTRALAQELVAAGLASAQVSLEGATPETHERVTAVRGSFARSLAAVSHLAAAGVLVHTNTTINRDNFHECARMPRFVKQRLGLSRFSMNLVIPTGSAIVERELAVRYSEVGPLLDAIRKESDSHDVEFMWYSPTPMCIYNPVAKGLGNKGCSACDGLISVAPNGDVLPCASYDESVGNLLEQDVATVWQSASAKRFRQKALAHPDCHDCADFQVCNGACPLYWRHMGFAELKTARGCERSPR